MNQVRALPRLDFECEFCGIRISHSENTALVTTVAAHHNQAIHQTKERRRPIGDEALVFAFPIEPSTADALLNALCEELPKGSADFWVTQFGVEFTVYEEPRWDGVLLAEGAKLQIAEIAARFVGGEFRWVQYQ